TSWTTVSTSSLQMDFDNSSFDHVPGNADEWDLEPARAFGIRLACSSSDVEIHESSSWWTLRDCTKKVWVTVATIVFDCYGKFESEVVSLRSLFLNRVVIVAASRLNAEVDTRWWFFEDDTKSQFCFHKMGLS